MMSRGRQFGLFLVTLACLGLIAFFSERFDASEISLERRRRLADGPLQFLTNFFPQKSNIFFAKSTEKELEFMDPKQVVAHNDAPKAKAQVISTVEQLKPTSKPVEFLDLNAVVVEKQKPAIKPNKPKEDGKIHFLQVGESKGSAVAKEPAAKITEKKKKVPRDRKEDLITIHNSKIEFVNPHPHLSPRNGSDISSERQGALLMCPKQATCIVPELQLAKKLKIYLCKHPTAHGVRFYYLAREGLYLHPNVELLTEDRIAEADFIMYPPASAPWHLTECTDPSYKSKLIVLDEFDGHQLISPTVTPEQYIERYGGRNKQWYFMYFKRSFVRRLDGDFKRYPHFVQPDVYPLVYAIAEAYVPTHFNNKRDIEIMCTLRGTKGMTTRLRAQTWIAEYGQQNKIENIVTQQLSTATRKEISLTYFQQMFNARIIVTVNPADWEGDFRLWESMCTGALIFVDPLYVPYPYPLVGGEHIVYFDNNNRTDLFTKLDYYRANPAEARRVAINGYLFAMKYHRTVNMMDYILRSADLQRTAARRERPLPHYTYTAQYLNYEAAAQEKSMVKCRSPGHYSPVPSDAHIANISEYKLHRLSCATPAAKIPISLPNNALVKRIPASVSKDGKGNIKFGGA